MRYCQTEHVFLKINVDGHVLEKTITKQEIENKIHDLLLTCKSFYNWSLKFKSEFERIESNIEEKISSGKSLFLFNMKSSPKLLLLQHNLFLNESLSILLSIINQFDLDRQIDIDTVINYREDRSEMSLGMWFNLFQQDFYNLKDGVEIPAKKVKKELIKITSNSTELKLLRNKYTGHKDFFRTGNQQIAYYRRVHPDLIQKFSSTLSEVSYFINLYFFDLQANNSFDDTYKRNFNDLIGLVLHKYPDELDKYLTKISDL